MTVSRLLLGVLVLTLCAGCTVTDELLMQTPPKEEAFFIVEVEKDAKTHTLYKVGEHDTTAMWEGEEGSFLYHSTTDHLYTVQEEKVLVRKEGAKETPIFHVPDTGFIIKGFAVREDEERIAVLLESEEKIFEVQTPCFDGRYCALETFEPATKETQFFGLPEWYHITFKEKWVKERPFPLLIGEAERIPGQDRIYMVLDGLGKSERQVRVKQNKNILPTLEIKEGETVVESVSFDAVEEEAQDAWRVFAVRSLQGILVKFPEDTLVPKGRSEVYVAPDMAKSLFLVNGMSYLYTHGKGSWEEFSPMEHFFSWENENQIRFLNRGVRSMQIVPKEELIDRIVTCGKSSVEKVETKDEEVLYVRRMRGDAVLQESIRGKQAKIVKCVSS